MLINPNLSGQLANDLRRETIARAERLRPARRLNRTDETSRPVAAPERRVRRSELRVTRGEQQVAKQGEAESGPRRDSIWVWPSSGGSSSDPHAFASANSSPSRRVEAATSTA